MCRPVANHFPHEPKHRKQPLTVSSLGVDVHSFVRKESGLKSEDILLKLVVIQHLHVKLQIPATNSYSHLNLSWGSFRGGIVPRNCGKQQVLVMGNCEFH